MKFNQIQGLMNESGMSPEQLASYFATSNMTIRRWKEKAGTEQVPELYENSVLNGVYRLVSDGKLSSDSRNVQNVLSKAPILSFEAALKDLGMEDMLTENASADYEDRMVLSLSKMGMSDSRRKEVDRNEGKILSFKKLGQEWGRRVSVLWDVVRSKRLSIIDKLVAYGALFYLIFPFDLIPDQIPVVGLLDDYAVLGSAVAFYLKKGTQSVKRIADQRQQSEGSRVP